MKKNYFFVSSQRSLILCVFNNVNPPNMIQFLWLPPPPPPSSEWASPLTLQGVDDAVRYLKSTFWHYGTNEDKYNYTKQQFVAVTIDF